MAAHFPDGKQTVQIGHTIHPVGQRIARECLAVYADMVRIAKAVRDLVGQIGLRAFVDFHEDIGAAQPFGPFRIKKRIFITANVA